jgi:hypothetical protein
MRSSLSKKLKILSEAHSIQLKTILKMETMSISQERDKFAKITASDVGFIKAIKLEELKEIESRERIEGEIKKPISDRRKQE